MKGGYPVQKDMESSAAIAEEELGSTPESTDVAEETVDDILKEAVDDGEYYAIPTVDASLIWSVASLSLAVISVILFAFFYVGGIIAAVFAIALAIVSSRKLGFFDRMALFGLIFGLFGLVFGVFSMIVDLTGVLDAAGI